ncbi:hypothetical protein PHSY_002432 [Pseudozyma hubeiensis SY62]|uniref:Secreted protein n=1 Tax=Pseudozyma hubeiensis (strain SY62) TaxID=1305764 RepID=R9P149_PSEHS|nr:hypothetical protein PHSY_002432 [Pseudozyma hubeiensis SY62]GAC94859.1 hypothetical protein PHSY_002432 [Pseudozyma hubeiensis SY62]
MAVAFPIQCFVCVALVAVRANDVRTQPERRGCPPKPTSILGSYDSTPNLSEKKTPTRLHRLLAVGQAVFFPFSDAYKYLVPASVKAQQYLPLLRALLAALLRRQCKGDGTATAKRDRSSTDENTGRLLNTVSGLSKRLAQIRKE